MLRLFATYFEDLPRIMDEKSDNSDDQLPNETEEVEGGSSQRPKIDADKLKEILERHRLFLEPDGDMGERANLRDANLQGANLRNTNLQQANLRGANLFLANLQEANLRDADLQGADLALADLQEAFLRGADLRGARGLNPSQVKAARSWESNYYSSELT